MTNLSFQTQKSSPNIIIVDGSNKTNVALEDITFVQAEHVYIRIHLTNNRQILHRISLQRFINQLPKGRFLQVHRSYIVNTRFIKCWDNNRAYLPGHQVPISRSRRKVINQMLLSA